MGSLHSSVGDKIVTFRACFKLTSGVSKSGSVTWSILSSSLTNFNQPYSSLRQTERPPGDCDVRAQCLRQHRPQGGPEREGPEGAGARQELP